MANLNNKRLYFWVKEALQSLMRSKPPEVINKRIVQPPTIFWNFTKDCKMRRDGQSFEERARLLRSEDRPYQSLGSVHHNKCKVYKRRWYILIVFSIVASLNNLIWNTWGPIQGAAQVVYGWNSTTITLLADWGPISFVVAVVPMCWLMDMKGKWSHNGFHSWFLKILPAAIDARHVARFSCRSIPRHRLWYEKYFFPFALTHYNVGTVMWVSLT